MNCPNCGQQYYCPCTSCFVRHPAGAKVWIWHEDGFTESCPTCGLRKSFDEWLTIEWEQYKKEKHEEAPKGNAESKEVL